MVVDLVWIILIWMSIRVRSASSLSRGQARISAGVMGAMQTEAPVTRAPLHLERHEWTDLAVQHRKRMESLLYPEHAEHGSTLKERRHAVDQHPIYNFLHTYYRYSAESLMRYSPGPGVRLLDTDMTSNSGLLHSVLLLLCCGRSVHRQDKLNSLRQPRDFMNTIDKQPVFSCYGLHEWAMLYKGHEKHQKQLDLREPGDY